MLRLLIALITFLVVDLVLTVGLTALGADLGSVEMLIIQVAAVIAAVLVWRRRAPHAT